jgi:hypothetical protein
VSPIVSEVDVARPPDEVFRYVTDPAVIREARKEVPQSCQKLKARLENDPGGPA